MENEMETSKLTNTASLSQKLARSSWMMFVLAVILTLLSRQIPRAEMPGEIATLLVLVTGVLCGVAGLFGMKGHNRGQVLWPSVVGIILNGLVLSIFANNFIVARAKALSSDAGTCAPLVHIGTWDTRTPRGELMSYTFTPDRFVLTVGTRKPISGSYLIDYAKKPIHFTIEMRDATGKTQPFPLILEFKDKDTMRMLGPPPGTTVRPTDFEGRSDVLEYTRRL